jgi:hypothetical protein
MPLVKKHAVVDIYDPTEPAIRIIGRRLIVPGWYGVANVKWLTRIVMRLFTSEEIAVILGKVRPLFLLKSF